MLHRCQTSQMRPGLIFDLKFSIAFSTLKESENITVCIGLISRIQLIARKIPISSAVKIETLSVILNFLLTLSDGTEKAAETLPDSGSLEPSVKICSLCL